MLQGMSALALSARLSSTKLAKSHKDVQLSSIYWFNSTLIHSVCAVVALSGARRELPCELHGLSSSATTPKLRSSTTPRLTAKRHAGNALTQESELRGAVP
jgi:hypothetical protein